MYPALYKMTTWIEPFIVLLPVLGFTWILVSPFGVSPAKLSDVPALGVISGISLWMLNALLKSVAQDPWRYFSKLPKLYKNDKRFGEHVVVFTGIKLTVLTGILVTSYQESFDVVFYLFLFVYLFNILVYLYVAYFRKKILLAMSEEMPHE
jgi:hypothetical protein